MSEKKQEKGHNSKSFDQINLKLTQIEVHSSTISQPEQAVTNTNLLKNPSKVLLLQNMVGPGEVDDELEPETAEECSKYGKVNKCVIYEVPDVPEEESVRIFVEFERMESAIKGLVDLNGRFFGGRVVNPFLTSEKDADKTPFSSSKSLLRCRTRPKNSDKF
ncbi:splicing factor 45-like [Plakobranchus ocellatus]|uniref:Splicing factor 45 n=1 Tax=Plakobranchus ocellatus TaxID=259542 RepID=A0AAV4DK56_9GAST|nr:splicing factor 45-like [Plakobranchus ocellatus]